MCKCSIKPCRCDDSWIDTRVRIEGERICSIPVKSTTSGQGTLTITNFMLSSCIGKEVDILIINK